jgi:lipopolysaccharide/colanic/teichoic acid biosynthesis glycosyltransferase
VCKRTLDVLGALLILVFYAPAAVVLIAALRLSRRGPILARETTVGLDGKPFGRWRLHRPTEGESLFDNLLWRAGLSDLPSAFNVIAGDMALIGPRPHSPEQHAHLLKGRTDYSRRFEARPGMVWPRAADGEPSLNADLDYVRQWSAFSDLRVAGLYAIHGLFRAEQDDA